METEETRQWERHVTANNHRLHTITQSLGDVNAFQGGCRELIQWCSDPRAFTAHFEANLLNALQAVVDNAAKEGFSSDLASELVALCHHHRRHLSKNASTRIGRWHEQFRRQKRNAKKKQKRDEEGNGNSQITQIQGYVEEPQTYVLVDPQQSIQTSEGVTVVTMWDGTMTQPMPSPSYPGYPPQYGMGMRPMDYGSMEGYDPAMMYQGQAPQMMMPHPGMMPRPMMHPNFDPAQFPHGIPSATNRVPGQVRPMPPYGMMPNYPQ
ncbi:unnamed protein product, partial [Mesorhabditis belari]|uniref:ZMIZ1 N-terminal domain-containing protein n=1 Tax=Mesorhabditis belari TaxID=2138241 RepID=A0AAF3JBD6_9BILA